MGQQRMTGYPLIDAVIGSPITGERIDRLMVELSGEKSVARAFGRALDVAEGIAAEIGVERKAFLSEVVAAASGIAEAVRAEVERRVV